MPKKIFLNQKIKFMIFGIYLIKFSPWGGGGEGEGGRSYLT
jgi:hypothetical protein